MPEIITIGETMIAFTPQTTGYLRYVKDFEVRIAGAESNTAIGVCKLGHSAGWVSFLGKDEFGAFVGNNIRAEGVDTSHVVWDSEHRTGLMVKEIRSSNTSVFYYRDDSAASFMDDRCLDEEYLKTCKVLHLSGITPILSASCAEMVEHAFEMAKKLHIDVSFDPNIRKKLWLDKDYSPMIRKMTLDSQIVELGIDEADRLFGEKDPVKIANILFTKGNAKFVGIKNGGDGAYVSDGNKFLEIPPIPCKCIDTVGAGDAFNSAFLVGYIEGQDLETAGKMGAIAGGLATENYGDFEGYPSRQEMDAFLGKTPIIYR